jgi:hypothetical protein
MKKEKVLKVWNGRGHGLKYQNGHFNVAAYTKKQACELIGQAAGLNRAADLTEINDYYSPCWGNDMAGITPTEPCIYGSVKAHYGIPEKII